MSLSVLYDLALAADTVGFAGIPQETRLLFYTLAQSEKIEISGLLRPDARSLYRRQKLQEIDAQASFIGPFLGGRVDDRSIPTRVIGRFIDRRIARIYQLLVQGRHLGTQLYPADPALTDIIWRRFFASTVPADGRKIIADTPYYLSKLGNERITLSTLKMLPVQRINTEGFRLIVNQDVKPLKVSRRTVKVIRYHDGIPIIAADTTINDRHVRMHLAAVRMCAPDCVFVCNSPSALSDLKALSPQAAERAAIIPNVLPHMERTAISRDALQTIADTRISSTSLSGHKKRKRALEAWFGKETKDSEVPPYILSVATLEPRKNFIRLIEAWREVRRRTGSNIRLMIVGKPGWEFKATLQAMRHYVESGELLHLESVPQTELPHLYSMALAFAFPSVMEGFGLPPTEAMQCGCPVVVSDIAAHQFMAGDAALYCDPYDVRSIATALEMCVTSKEVRQVLTERGYQNVRRFLEQPLREAWEDVLHQAALIGDTNVSLPAIPPFEGIHGAQRNMEIIAQASRMTAGATFSQTQPEVSSPVARQ